MIFHVQPFISNCKVKGCFPRFYLFNKHWLKTYSLLGTIRCFQYIEGAQEMFDRWKNERKNEWTNESWPSHRCPSWIQQDIGDRQACSSLRPHLPPTLGPLHSSPGLPACGATGLRPSPISLLGFWPRSSDKEVVIRTHPLYYYSQRL